MYSKFFICLSLISTFAAPSLGAASDQPCMPSFPINPEVTGFPLGPKVPSDPRNGKNPGKPSKPGQGGKKGDSQNDGVREVEEKLLRQLKKREKRLEAIIAGVEKIIRDLKAKYGKSKGKKKQGGRD